MPPRSNSLPATTVRVSGFAEPAVSGGAAWPDEEATGPPAASAPQKTTRTRRMTSSFRRRRLTPPPGRRRRSLRRREPPVLADDEHREADGHQDEDHVEAGEAGHAAVDDVRAEEDDPAASMSPARTKNVSIACLALYFSSRLVGSQIICFAVFITE